MTAIRPVVLALLCIVMLASLLDAQSRPDYRTYQLGDDVDTISRQIGGPAATVGSLHRGLTAVQELRWRAEYDRRGVAPSTDPVARLVFSFYDNRLFRIVVDYSPDRTAGMTEADMVDAVSQVYGPPARRTDPPTRVGLRSPRPADSVIAQWTDGEHQVALLAVQDRTAFRMIVASVPLEALARAAGEPEAPADPHDWASNPAGRLTADLERSGSAWQHTRRANIASFVP